MEKPVLFGTCTWLARKFGWSTAQTRFVVAFLAVADPTFAVGLLYVIAGLTLGDGPADDIV